MCTCTCWGKGGVPSGRFQEQDFSLFVVSFLRKHTHTYSFTVFSGTGQTKPRGEVLRDGVIIQAAIEPYTKM